MWCGCDADALIKANPILEEAIDTYMISYQYWGQSDTTTGWNYGIGIFLDQDVEQALREACADLGGNFGCKHRPTSMRTRHPHQLFRQLRLVPCKHSRMPSQRQL